MQRLLFSPTPRYARGMRQAIGVVGVAEGRVWVGGVVGGSALGARVVGGREEGRGVGEAEGRGVDGAEGVVGGGKRVEGAECTSAPPPRNPGRELRLMELPFRSQNSLR